MTASAGWSSSLETIFARNNDHAKFIKERFDLAYPEYAGHFVWVVVTHLTERGVMDVELLYEPPFTDHAPHGPEDLFSGSDVDALVDALTAVRATAGQAEGVA